MGIENGVASDCACLGEITGALFGGGVAVRAMRDVTRGGLGTILNEIADSSACAFELEEGSIPVDEEVAAFCGVLGLDPIYMGNEGKMVAVVTGADAYRALELIRAT
jgi:hydrogenase expression/formation protein HypE